MIDIVLIIDIIGISCVILFMAFMKGYGVGRASTYGEDE